MAVLKKRFLELVVSGSSNLLQGISSNLVLPLDEACRCPERAIRVARCVCHYLIYTHCVSQSHISHLPALRMLGIFLHCIISKSNFFCFFSNSFLMFYSFYARIIDLLCLRPRCLCFANEQLRSYAFRSRSGCELELSETILTFQVRQLTDVQVQHLVKMTRDFTLLFYKVN